MVKGNTVSEAYLSYLKNYLSDWSFATSTHVLDPVKYGEVNLHSSIDSVFRSFTFPKGKTGEYWIEDRKDVLFGKNHTYYKRMRRNGQYDYVLNSLSEYQKNPIKYGTWNANRFIITLLDARLRKDDPSADLGKNRNPDPPCLISLSFHPYKKKLHLISTFRAQFVDTKAYGNMIASAMLLNQFCKQTGFEPGTLHNIAYKPISKHSKKIVKKLYDSLN